MSKKSQSDYNRALQAGEKLSAAVSIAREANRDNSLLFFLLENAKNYHVVPGFKASSVVFPDTTDKPGLALGYEWSYIELYSEEALASNIIDKLISEINAGELPGSISDYVV